MESRAISDSQISASSEKDASHSAKRARLNRKLNGANYLRGGWSAGILEDNQWLQIDLGSYTTVTRVATQGRNVVSQWVTKYRLQYSNDGVIFHPYRERGDTSAKVRSPRPPFNVPSHWLYKFYASLFRFCACFTYCTKVALVLFTAGKKMSERSSHAFITFQKHTKRRKIISRSSASSWMPPKQYITHPLCWVVTHFRAWRIHAVYSFIR